MKARLLTFLLVFIFAVAAGDFAFRTWNFPFTPEYMTEAVVRPLTLSGPPGKHLYLRRSWHLTRAPEQAWIQLLGHDRLELFVNGRRAGRTEPSNRNPIVALTTDITPYLHVGENSISVHALQTTLDRPPAVAINGQCQFADGSQQALDDPNDWRASDVYDRRGHFWYETEFSDKHWAAPRVGEPVAWRGQVAVPPRAITVPRDSFWILPADAEDGAAVFARRFELPGQPRECWIRVLATGPYRLAINGWIIANDHFALARVDPYEALERTFDVSALLKSGANTVALAVTTRGESPRLRADLEATNDRGERFYVATNGDWLSSPGNLPNWHRAESLDGAGWKTCRAEVGYLQVVPRRIVREIGELKLPVEFWLSRSATYVGIVAIVAIAAWLGCWLTTRVLQQLTDSKIAPSPALVLLPCLALVPSTIAAAAGRLMTWDYAWSWHDIYQPRWLVMLLLLAVGQWLLLVLVAHRPSSHFASAVASLRKPRVWRRLGWAACWTVVFGIALWLRVRHILAEPIHHDEVGAYAFTQGVLNHGFPGGQAHPDLPFGYCSTSELAYYPTALCELFVDDPRLVLRIPAVIWSMATLMLLGYMGSRWFGPWAGIVAAVLYGLSPHVIGWANLGRYLSQVQFFTLLTMYCAYEAFRAPLVRKGMVWAAAFSMVAMYLSWEGAGMFGIGLALAVVMLRRNNARPVLSCPSVYAAGAFVLLVVAAQNAHRLTQQTQRLWYGEGISDLSLKPMWRYPFFDFDFFLMNSSWTRDAFVPMVAFAAACFLAVRHRWRVPIRFCIICLASNALLMAAFLPLRTNRYSYHLLPITVLLAAAVFAAVAESLLRVGHQANLLGAHRAYARTVAVGALVAFVALASGQIVRTSELDDFVVSAYDVGDLRYPHWDGPTQYLKEHVREGDVVIATVPHANVFFSSTVDDDGAKSSLVDYWLESTLIIQATLGDAQAVPLDRRSGATMLYDLDHLKQLFAEHDRVWYCTLRYGQAHINDSNVSKFLRENMDVVYEDYATAVMLRDNNHRTAPLRVEESDAGQLASDFYLR